MLADHADEWAEDWASNSQDTHGGGREQVTHEAAVATLRRAYAAMLRKGGLDHVERITMEEARAFPSFALAAPEGGLGRRLSPSSITGLALTGGAGFGAAAIPAAGMGMKRLRNALTTGAARNLSQT